MHGLDPRRLRAAGEEALGEIERMHRQLSAFDSHSDISWINSHAATEAVKVEPALFALIRQSQEIHSLTDGAFDITVGPLMKAWGFAGAESYPPSDDDLAAAIAVTGVDKLLLDEATSTVRFACRGVRIDLGAIGKGVAIDRAAEVLRDAGIDNALIHGGTSSIHAIGSDKERKDPFSSGSAWRVSVCGLDTIDLRDSSLSVSALHGKSFELDGARYGHVIDPRTGRPLAFDGNEGVTAVTGPSAAVCDALSTALLVLGRDWLPDLRSRFPGYLGSVYPNSDV